MSACAEQLCTAWQQTGDPRTADELIRAIRHGIRRVAKKLAYRFTNRSVIDLYDLESVGLAAAFESMPRFDATRGVRFVTFAMKRAVGAMKDEMRAADPLTRSHRKKLEAAGVEFRVGSIDHVGDDRDQTFAVAAPTQSKASFEDFDRHLVGMSGRQKAVMRMRFVEGMTQREIAGAIGLVESRISQMIASILRDLRNRS